MLERLKTIRNIFCLRFIRRLAWMHFREGKADPYHVEILIKFVSLIPR